MKLKLTLQRPSGPEADIVVITDAAASVGDVAAAIAARDPYVAKVATGPTVPVTLRIMEAGAATQLEPEQTIIETPLASGATVGIVPPDSAPPPRPTAAAAVLRVIEGQDAGASFPLQLGTHHLGRDAAVSDVTLTDPLVSKRHARIDVFSRSVRLVDLNSANGLEVDGGVVSRIDLEDGATVRVGDTLLQAELVAPGAELAPAPSGPVAFNRSPRVETRYPGREYDAPKMPSDREPQPFPWIVLAVPLVMGIAFMFLMPGRGVQSLIFVAAAPLLMLGTWFTTRSNRRRKERQELALFATRIEHLEEALAAEVDVERTVRKQESPTTAEVTESAMRLGPLLWTRRPEHWQFLSIHLGMGTMESRNVVKLAPEDSGEPKYLEQARAVHDKYRMIADVPVTENLFFSGSLGIAGRQADAADLARSAVVQLTGLHSPAELVVAAIVSNAWTPEFEWLKWLPHTGSPHSPIEASHLANSQATADALLASLEELITSRGTAKVEARGAAMIDRSALVAGASAGDGAEVATPPPSATPAILLLISDDAPVDRARLVQVAEKAADAGVYPIWVSATVPELPAVARTFVEANEEGDPARVGLVRLGADVTDVVTEPVSREDALRFARRLAPVIDAGALLRDESDLPRTVSMLSLLGSPIAAHPEVAVERWRENDSIHDRSGGPLSKRRAGKLRALVGQSGVDAMHLDLRTQGPHALVGGTTGSGKASSSRPGCSAWPRSTALTASRSSSSTTRAAPRSRSA